ncbi:hypothetical protein I4U23_005913 [Adineta vaga]|nr:hypothetical protein I4U23_005913 [Adineta vaga]
MKFIISLLLCSFAVLAFRLHIKTYNLLYGPFHVNLNNIYSCHQQYMDESYWSFYAEYLELELGEDQIEDGPLLYTYHYFHPYRNPSGVFRKVKKIESDSSFTRLFESGLKMKVKISDGDEREIILDIFSLKLYIKLPTIYSSKYHSRHSYRFHLYSIDTLRCIMHKLNEIKRSKNPTWIDKLPYVSYIEEMYSKDPTTFNEAIVRKCGIFIGYLYKPRGELV